MEIRTSDRPPGKGATGKGPERGGPRRQNERSARKLAGPNGEVHLWPIALGEPARQGPGEAALLSVDETARAARFRFDRDRRHFIAGRAALRRILARYLDMDPPTLRFAYGAAGKPALSGPPESEEIQFNLSHSAGQALLAVARGRPLGVDLEALRPSDDLPAVAKRFFARGELSALADIPQALYAQAFFACWTRKEALLKAYGGGLSLPLDGFCVSVDPRAPARLISTDFDPGAAGRWSLMDLALEAPLDQRFRAALAIEGPLPYCRVCSLER